MASLPVQTRGNIVRSKRPLVVAAGISLAAAFSVACAAEPDIVPLVRKAEFGDIKISPSGEYYAATVPLEDRTALAILRRSDSKITGSFSIGKNGHVADFWWVNPQRVLLTTVQKIGALDSPQWTGELYGVDADGGQAEILVGQGVDVMTTGSNIVTKRNEKIVATMVDDLPADPKSVVISASSFGNDPSSRAERMDVNSGRRSVIARSPIRNATFVTDNGGAVRFVQGVEQTNASRLYYRNQAGGDWELINDESVTRHAEYPLGFAEDNKTAYLQIEQVDGPDTIVAMDMDTKIRKVVLRDDDADPSRIIYRQGTSIPVGARFAVGKPRTAFFDATDPEARLYRSLEAALPGRSPFITSSTSDGTLALVQVSSDRQPDEFFIFDIQAKKMVYLLSTRSWIDPEKSGERRPISLVSRDNLPLKGYLTIPAGSTSKNLPLVVLPHGGPFGISDKWEYDDDSQILAAAGYAVLQVNYRGSGGRGRAFYQAGAREWGGKMQDDLTDATRWAIHEGIADANRICIYGASYGGYAALMGAAKEQALYKCAAGYVGVYDLPLMQSTDSRESKRFGNWSLEWVGERSQLGAVSPDLLADRIKVPVFLAAGGEDKTAPIEHSKKMEQALRKAGVPVETLYYPTEGHGFYVEAHRREFYTRLLAFLDRNIGTATVASAK